METPAILVVDDELSNVKVLIESLKDQGYRLLVARSGDRALQQLEHVKPDLILLDVMMPGMDGFETCRRLKANEHTKDIPVIFMTALIEMADKVKGFAVGGVDYITKPFQLQEVLARLKAHLAVRNLQQQLQYEHERFRGLSSATFEGILIHDHDTIVEVNQAIERLTGYTRAELLGKSVFDLLITKSQDIPVEQAQSGTEQPYEVNGIRKDGTIVPFEMQSKTIFYQKRTLNVLAVRDITWRKTLERENLALRVTLNDSDHFGELVGKSPMMKKVYERIVNAAASDEIVIIYGETGTGKELVARTIFQVSEHHHRSFVPVNCGAIQESLFESQFFGYRKGAFTGADRDTPGYFDQAQDGTLFLDEVGELTPAMQAKLLRVLNDKTYIPVGATTSRTADVRIIAASNQELRKLLSEGRIREDFFHRLHVIAINLPPLRWHKEDIPLLIAYFLTQRTALGARPPIVPANIVEQFFAYDWPGNVRELFNELRRYLTTGELELAGTQPVTPFDGRGMPFFQDGLLLSEAVDAFEQYYITRTLKQKQGQKNKTAEALGVDRRTLYNKLKKYEAP